MANVYAWPPVGVWAQSWAPEAPVGRSESALTGRRYVSAALRRRRLAQIRVSGASCGGLAAGYMDMLAELIDGGVHLIRLRSARFNRARIDALRAGTPVAWTDGVIPVEWTEGGSPVTWIEGAALTGTPGTSGGWPILTVSGLPPSVPVIGPGEYLTVYADAGDTTGTQVRALRPALSNANGVAVIRLESAAPSGARVSLGTSESLVFEAIEAPVPLTARFGDILYEWTLRQVFVDEVTGGFTELDPWG